MKLLQKIFSDFASACITLVCISILTFSLVRLIPGGPFDSDRVFAPEVMQSLQKKFRLDLPAYKQYFHYMGDLVLRGDFGPSIKYAGRTVGDIIQETLPVSVELGCYAMMIAIFLGITLGIIAAAYRGTWLDLSTMFLAISGVSLPSFLVAALAILVFAQSLGWFPIALWDGPEHRILPSIVLGLRPAAIIARMTRSSVLEIIYLDYVKTARAKGLGPLKVFGVHVLRNALIPIVTLLGPLAATVLTGSFIIEHIFSIPGLATHFIQAVSNRDYPLIMGVTLIYAAFLVVANLLVDVAYGFIDPRMRQ